MNNYAFVYKEQIFKSNLKNYRISSIIIKNNNLSRKICIK